VALSRRLNIHFVARLIAEESPDDETLTAIVVVTASALPPGTRRAS